jgi:hypothetical protein
MKTAMQRLIANLETMGITFPQGIQQTFLSIEKEQIVNAFEVGYKSCDIDEAFEINRKLASGENHYNKTYNQTL